TDYLPSGLLYAGVPGTNSIAVATSPGIGNNGNVTWNIGTLATSGSTTLDILVFPNVAGSYTNVAAISDGTALNTRNDSTTAVTAGGSGYTSAPNVNFSGGGAVATATVSGGVVTGVVITNAGSGYVSAPGVTFSGGGGSGAFASASLGSTSSPTWIGQSIAGNGTLTIAFDADVAASVPTGDYENQILGASTNVPALIFDYLGTTQENVHVCATAPTIQAPAALCANST